MGVLVVPTNQAATKLHTVQPQIPFARALHSSAAPWKRGDYHRLMARKASRDSKGPPGEVVFARGVCGVLAGLEGVILPG